MTLAEFWPYLWAWIRDERERLAAFEAEVLEKHAGKFTTTLEQHRRAFEVPTSFYEQPITKAPRQHQCDAGYFDRTVCACGVMHSYCTMCSERQDHCAAEANL